MPLGWGGMKGNWLTIFPMVAGLGLAGQTGDGEDLEDGGEGLGEGPRGGALRTGLRLQERDCCRDWGERWLRCSLGL